MFFFPSDGQSDSDWWQTASFYQIYPRSFQDSNGDGIGDLNGITERLGYLKEIGIKATWLSPIFKSPMADFGYDISDFYAIQPEYGTMDDFEKLIRKAKEIGVKIILDFVPNHSSDENEWFRKSVKRDTKFENFYIWHPGVVDPKNSSSRLPPNNWVSVFTKSAWQYNDERKEFYLHQFAVKQPDLNYRNPMVIEEMKVKTEIPIFSFVFKKKIFFRMFYVSGWIEVCQVFELTPCLIYLKLRKTSTVIIPMNLSVEIQMTQMTGII